MNERLFVKDRSWRARVRCFRDALRGLGILLATQANARVHAALTAGAIALGWYVQLSATEWLFITGAIGLVWVAEAFNTAIEFLVDLVSPQHNSLAGRVKDVAAGAVLASAVTAALVGAIIFVPKIPA